MTNTRPESSHMNVRTMMGALSGHLDIHPDLVDTALSARVERDRVDVLAYGTDNVGKLEVLARWAGTLLDATQVEITWVAEAPDWAPDSGSQTHLRVVGRVAGGARVEVTVVLRDWVAVDLLDANTPVAQGGTFPVELLWRLVDRDRAEGLPARDAVTG